MFTEKVSMLYILLTVKWEKRNFRTTYIAINSRENRGGEDR